MTFNASPQQQAIFDWCRTGTGHGMVDAVAGSGKTTTVVNALPFMKGGSILFCAFNKEMALELGRRTAGNSLVNSSTLHSVGFTAFKDSGRRAKVDSYKTSNILDGIVGPAKGDNWERRVALNVVTQLVGYAKSAGAQTYLLPEGSWDWQFFADHYDLELPDDPTQVFTLASQVLAASNADFSLIDFDDMLYLPLLLRLKFRKYAWVVIDEAQDTNATRREIASLSLARPAGRLLAVGDPHQAIYGFAGAQNDAMKLIAEQFGCQQFPLHTTYRCPEKVVEYCQQWVPHFQAKDGAPAGSVLPVTNDFMLRRAEGGQAVLCRFTAPLVSTCFAFIRAGKGAKVEGRQIGAGLVKLCQKWKRVSSSSQLAAKLEEHYELEQRKADTRPKKAKLPRLRDTIDTLKVVIDRAEELYGVDCPVSKVEAVILSIFADDITGPNVITCSSIHRAKGREWDTVWWLGREELQPSRYASSGWELEQEYHLLYVAGSRAVQTLCLVAMPEKK